MFIFEKKVFLDINLVRLNKYFPRYHCSLDKKTFEIYKNNI
jgi:hypothetical protein